MDMEILFPGGKKVNALYKGFTIPTDQPKNSGGNETAPSPFDLFIASLGTCAGFYVNQFCLDRGIPTDGLKLQLFTEKNPDKKIIDRVRIEIQLPPTFPDKYKKAVIKAAEACTVKKQLEDPPEIETVIFE